MSVNLMGVLDYFVHNLFCFYSKINNQIQYTATFSSCSFSLFEHTHSLIFIRNAGNCTVYSNASK